jgi:hypothetical protein
VRAAGAGKRDPEQADVFNVPEALRAPGKPAVTQHVRFYALDDVFPGTGLGAAFDSDASFRAALHQVGERFGVSSVDAQTAGLVRL